VFPKPPLFLGLGACLGLFVGLGAALVAEYLDPTVKDSEVLQAVQGYPVLGLHPALPGSRRRLRAAACGRRSRARTRRRRGRRRRWALGRSLPGEAALHDEGVVILRKVVPVIESLEDDNSVVGEELRSFAANLVDLPAPRVKCLALHQRAARRGQEHAQRWAWPARSDGSRARDPAHRGRPAAGRRSRRRSASLRRTGSSEWLNGTLDYVPVGRSSRRASIS
jgi:hypothetical protein